MQYNYNTYCRYSFVSAKISVFHSINLHDSQLQTCFRILEPLPKIRSDHYPTEITIPIIIIKILPGPMKTQPLSPDRNPPTLQRRKTSFSVNRAASVNKSSEIVLNFDPSEFRLFTAIFNRNLNKLYDLDKQGIFKDLDQKTVSCQLQDGLSQKQAQQIMKRFRNKAVKDSLARNEAIKATTQAYCKQHKQFKERCATRTRFWNRNEGKIKIECTSFCKNLAQPSEQKRQIFNKKMIEISKVRPITSKRLPYTKPDFSYLYKNNSSKIQKQPIQTENEKFVCLENEETGASTEIGTENNFGEGDNTSKNFMTSPNSYPDSVRKLGKELDFKQKYRKYCEYFNQFFLSAFPKRETHPSKSIYSYANTEVAKSLLSCKKRSISFQKQELKKQRPQDKLKAPKEQLSVSTTKCQGYKARARSWINPQDTFMRSGASFTSSIQDFERIVWADRIRSCFKQKASFNQTIFGNKI